MSKLTKNVREQMARKLVAHRYTDEAKELVRLNRTLAERAYNHRYTPQIIAHMEAINKEFPRNFIKVPYFTVNANGFRVHLGGPMYNNWVKIEQVQHDGWLVVSGSYSIHDLTDGALAKDIQDYATRWQGFDDVCKTAYHEALSVLNTITTGKKLAEAWPEAIPVIGDLIPEDQRTLPVVQVSAINAKFKLPPEEQK